MPVTKLPAIGSGRDTARQADHQQPARPNSARTGSRPQRAAPRGHHDERSGEEATRWAPGCSGRAPGDRTSGRTSPIRQVHREHGQVGAAAVRSKPPAWNNGAAIRVRRNEGRDGGEGEANEANGGRRPASVSPCVNAKTSAPAGLVPGRRRSRRRRPLAPLDSATRAGADRDDRRNTTFTLDDQRH